MSDHNIVIAWAMTRKRTLISGEKLAEVIIEEVTVEEVLEDFS